MAISSSSSPDTAGPQCPLSSPYKRRPLLQHKGVGGVFVFELVCMCVTPICLTDSWLFTFHYTIEKLCQELFGILTDQRNVRCCHVDQRKLFVNIKLSALFVKILLTGPEDCLLSPTVLFGAHHRG